MKIALIGDYDASVAAHQAVPRALEPTGNRVFVSTSYQPERSAFHGIRHPSISAFLIAAM